MNTKLHQILLFLSIIIARSISGQNAKVDSLENLLKTHIAEDTVKVKLLNEIAIGLYEKNPEKARGYSILASELSDKVNFRKGKSQSLLVIGLSYVRLDEKKAFEYIQNSLKIAEFVDDKILIINGLSAMGKAYLNSGKDSLGFVSYQKAITSAETINNQKEMAKCLNDLSLAYYTRGKNEKAIEGFNKVIATFEALGEKELLSSAYIRLGTLYATQGNHPMALECFQNCLKISENLNNKVGVFMCINSIGNIYSSQENLEKSFEYRQKALQLAEELDDKSRITMCLMNLGNHYLKTNNPLAMDCFQKALVYGEELNVPIFIKGALEKIGNVYENQGDFVKAMAYYQKALKAAEEHGLKTSGTSTLYFAGRICLKQKKYGEALSYSLRSLGNSNQFEPKQEIYGQLSEIYAATGDYKKAYTYHKRFKELNDSIYNESNIKKITELEHIYKFEKEKQAIELEQKKKDLIKAAELKQKHIIILSLTGGVMLMIMLVVYIYRSNRLQRKTNLKLTQQKFEIEEKNEELVLLNEAILAQKEEISAISHEVELQNRKLQELNAAKDKFFGIIAHDLKNPFNAILGFSNLLVASAHDYSQDEVLKFADIMHTSANNAYKLLENLLEWSRSQTGIIEYRPNKLWVSDLMVEVDDLCRNMAKEKSIAIQHEIPADLMVFADQNMISAILRNLITNAIKFTHKGGKISITAQVHELNTVIAVIDTGIGMDEATRNRLFKINEKILITGTEKETGTGLGLLLCKEFVEKHGGEIWVESELGRGSEFKFSIPSQQASIDLQ